MVTITIYGKPGCHLCDNVRNILESVQKRYTFELHEENIMLDEDLFDKYVVDIPVVSIDGEYFCQYSVDPNALEQKLESLTKLNFGPT